MIDYDSHEHKVMTAKKEITECKALKVLLLNNDLGAEISIAGMKMGTAENKWLIPVINKQMKEIQKFLDGKPNIWE